MTGSLPLLTVEDLSVEFRTRDGIVKALEAVGFDVSKGETLAIVGESGSGKSVTALSIMGILPPAGRVTAGRVVFEGLDLLTASPAQLAEYRGRELSMVFQSARTSLNPIRTIGKQLGDVLLRHANLPRHRIKERAIELLGRVQIPDPSRRYDAFPFELSGGMCQRVMIALAVACSPARLIADEPTTGLDVTTQAAIMALLGELGTERRMATIMITHDLALAAEVCDRIVVMHAGHVVENAPTRGVFASPRHPYTARLIASTPRPGATLGDLAPIDGAVPDLRDPLPPCRYRVRCDRAGAACDELPLPRIRPAPERMVACHQPL